MEKKQKDRFGDLNILGIPIDPTLGVGDKILDHVDESIEAKKRKEAASKYWMRCPSCGKRVVKKELIKKGCYACGWKGTEEEIELAQVKQMSETKSTAPKKEDTHSYWTDCPKCGRRVVREELGEKGCFICGYKPEMEDKRDE
jgi:acetyl-CoA carboxylase beta subunit